MAVYGYVRTSRPPRRKADAGSSPLGIESQRSAILEAFPDAEIHVDQFCSGRRVNRPALRTMVGRLVRGDLVVVVRLDRLARGMRLAMAIEHEVEDVRRARIVSLAGEGTSADGAPDAYAVFVRRVHQATAELQAAQAARTTRDALAVRRRKGLAVTGSPPWGHRLHGDRLVPDPAEQHALEVARVFVARCGSSPVPAELARVLNKAGATNRRGAPVTRDTAARILRQLEQQEATPPRRRSK